MMDNTNIRSAYFTSSDLNVRIAEFTDFAKSMLLSILGGLACWNAE